MRFLHDEFVTGEPASDRTRQAQRDIREEISVMTHSYIYHPNLVTLDLGAGVILQQASSTGDFGNASSSGELTNFSARANFLANKPFRGSVFFDRQHPTVNIAPGVVLNEQMTRYGLGLALVEPVTPVSLQLDATHTQHEGRSVDRIVNDQIDQLSLRASRSFGAVGSTEVLYHTAQTESQSGSPNLPIQGSTSSSRGLDANTQLHLGSNLQYDLTNILYLNSQNYSLNQGDLPQRNDARVMFNLRGRHSAQWQSFGLVSYSSSDQGDLKSASHSVSGGLNFFPTREVTAIASIHEDANTTQQTSASARGINASIAYQSPAPGGAVQASYAVHYDQIDQASSSSQIKIVGESLALSGTTPVALVNQHVNLISITVSNTGRTQTYVEGFDYTVAVVGFQTRLQRVVGGNILDGQSVLIDYAYDSGGTYTANQFDRTLNLNWSFRSLGNVYFRRFESEPRLTSGQPSFLLNTIASNILGARADVPLNTKLDTSLGGGIEYEDHKETVLPFRRESSDIYARVQDPLFDSGNLQASMRRSRIEYQSSPLGLNLRGYDLRYTSRHWFGLDFAANATYEIDTGSPIERKRMIEAVKAQWRYRKLSLSAEFQHTRESQGLVVVSRTLFQMQARRDF